MSFVIRSAWSTDLVRLVNLAETCQAEPELSCAYLNDDAPGITSELVKINGTDDWTTVTWVALDDARRLMGWIAAEADLALGRIWWFGPFVSEPMSLLTDSVLDGLFRTAHAALGGFAEHEMAFYEDAPLLERFAERNGFAVEEKSALLRTSILDVRVPDSRVRVEPVVDPTPELIALHDDLFPQTHSPGHHLFGRVDERHDRFAAYVDDELVGYVATEIQHSTSLYIDYIGVHVDWRQQGIARSLLTAAMRHRHSEVLHAHLTVRDGNVAANRLYASVGFEPDRVIVPYRRGFTLD